MTAPQASSRLEMLQARFQQKQLQEKEQKLLQLYDQQQQRAYQVVQRGSAGSNSSNHSSTTIKTSTTTTSTSQRGKVRQMFDERRQTTVKGIDRSYPLEPLENKLRKQTNTNNVATQRNGNLTVNRQSVSVKRVARADVNSNVNNGKPVVSYQEEITRESFEPPTHRYNDEDEFGLENRVTTFANGYYRPDADNEEEIALDQETIERNRMMAKIHLMGFDETLKHRVRNDLESEEFPEYLMVDMSDKLPKKNATKKLTQAEARLERFKNANAKRSDMLKQSTSNKRSKQAVPITSNRITKSPSPDSAARKQLKSNTRGNAPASPSKSSDIAPKRASANPKNQDAKPSRKSAKDADSIGNRATTAEAIDTTDGVVLQNNTRESTPKSSDIFKQQTASNVSDRPISSVSSNSSANSTQGQISNTKNKMTTRTKTSADNLVACNICERRFARDRISYHEQICVKTTNKKRKKFDTTMFRVKGTELEPFVKKGLSKKQETTKKPEVKSNWRRKHEDFINTIRSAKEYQAAVAKGINPADLPPPPPSDTSDYIQCPHCGRKFNEAAAERHISKCENMLHNKPMHMRAKLRR
nr:PREDICTED: uncharacterized protein DDB_G0286299-like isoform X4 [Linepithema humile]